MKMDRHNTTEVLTEDVLRNLRPPFVKKSAYRDSAQVQERMQVGGRPKRALHETGLSGSTN